MLIISSVFFLGMGGNEILFIGVPIAAFLVAGFLFGRIYPKVFLKAAIVLVLPLTILVIAGFFRAEYFDQQFVIDRISTIFIAVSLSLLGSYIGRKTAKEK